MGFTVVDWCRPFEPAVISCSAPVADAASIGRIDGLPSSGQSGARSRRHTGSGKQAEDEMARLSRTYNVVNELFRMQARTAGQLFFDQLEQTRVANEALVSQARANDLANFRSRFTDVFLRTIVCRTDDHVKIIKQILDEPAFQTTVLDHYLQRVFLVANTEGMR